MKRLTAIVLVICLTAALLIPAHAADEREIQSVVSSLGIITGDESGNLNLANTVTRAEFTKMMISASVYKDTVGDGSGSSSFKDVKHTHWAADYIRAVVDAGWMTGYVDGTFRPSNAITYEEVASAVLKMLGYTPADLVGTFPRAQISKFTALKLGTGLNLVQGRAVTRRECMYIFYNLMGAADKSGQLYGIMLGHPMTTDGKIDYDAMVKSDTEGPFVMRSAALADVIPFDTRVATVYRNGRLTTPADVGQYDVVYYNANTRTVWTYSNRAIGVLTAIEPSNVAPEAVTVAGNRYTLGTAAAKNKVSATGEFAVGDTLALLLGMEGEVADIIAASAVDGSYYGVVTARELVTYAVDSSRSVTSYVLTVACTDGFSRQCTVPTDTIYAVGNVVAVTYAKGEITVRRPGSSNYSGAVSSDGKRLGEYAFAPDVGILDVSREGNWSSITPSRLAGLTLPQGSIYHYVLNGNNEINHLILNDATGDMYDYGIITAVELSTDPSTVNTTYRYIINGVPGALNGGFVLYNINSGPAIFYYKQDGQLDRMRNLTETKLTALSELHATGENRRFGIAPEVQVYLRDENYTYRLIPLSSVNTAEFNLTAYYDSGMYAVGNQIRVIIATKK